MSKKTRKGASARTKSSAQREAARQTGLQEAERLLRRKRPQEALAVLQQLEQSYPNDEELLALLVNTCLDLNDLQGYQRYAERLLPKRSNDPDLLLALAGVYAANRYPALAVRTFRRFLERHPDHPKAEDARQRLIELETALDERLSTLGLTGVDRLELAELHDRVGIALNTGDFPQGRKAGQQLLSRLPTFIPAHNNLSLMDFACVIPPSAARPRRDAAARRPRCVRGRSAAGRPGAHVGAGQMARYHPLSIRHHLGITEPALTRYYRTPCHSDVCLAQEQAGGG